MAAPEGERPRRGAEEAPAGTLEERLEGARKSLWQVSECSDLADQCEMLLSRARLEGEARRAAVARDLVTRAECALRRAKMSWDSLKVWVPIVIGYQAILLAGLVYLLFRLKPGADDTLAVQLVPYAAWGGLGGVIAALYGIYLHAAKRDFDRGYLPFYFLKPVLGLVLGPVMYLFVKAGMAATGVQPQAAAAGAGEPPGTAGALPPSEFLLLAAFAVGFGERFTIRLIDRVASAIFGDAEAPRQGPQRPPAEAAGSLAGTVAAAKGDLVLEVTGVDANQGLVKLLRDGAEVQPEKAEVKDGKFALSGLAPGEYEVQVQATEEAEWRPTSPAKVKVEAGKEAPFTLEVK